eukprot:17687-Heterococcus_DN1.PRE.1
MAYQQKKVRSRCLNCGIAVGCSYTMAGEATTTFCSQDCRVTCCVTGRTNFPCSVDAKGDLNVFTEAPLQAAIRRSASTSSCSDCSVTSSSCGDRDSPSSDPMPVPTSSRRWRSSTRYL